MTQLGADPEALESLAAFFEATAGKVETEAAGIDRGLGQVFWQGNHADGFRSDWRSTHSPGIRQTVDQFRDQARLLRENAVAQRTASEASGGSTTGVFGPPGAGGVQSGGEKITDGLRLSGWESTTGQPLFLSGGDAGEVDISGSDIKQNSLGDCYFVATLAAVASSNPELIRNGIVENSDGTYTVTLYEEVDGELKPVEVTVDGDVPKLEVWNERDETWVDGSPVGEGDGELWPRMYEKAYADYLGDGDLTRGYEEIIGGHGSDALEALTGIEAQTIGTGDLTIEELRDLSDNGAVLSTSQSYIPGSGFMGFGKDTGPYTIGDDSLVTRHQYWVESIDGDIITVQNPWEYDTYQHEMTIDEFNDAFRNVQYSPVAP